MKSIWKITVVTASIMLLSCEKEISVYDSNVAGDIAITFVAEKPSIDENTKTAWNGEKVLWQEGDQIKVACLRDGLYWQTQVNNVAQDATSSSAAKLYSSSRLSEACESAKFVFGSSSIFNWTAEGTYQFYAIAPSSLVPNSPFPNAPSIDVTIKPTQNYFSDTFDPDADVLVGKSNSTFTEPITTSTEVSLSVKRLVALSKITFSSLKGASSDEKVTKVTISAQDDAKLTGSATVNLLNGTINSEIGGNEVTVQNTNGIALNDGCFSAWFSTMEFTATSLSITIESNLATYTRSIDLSSTPKSFLRNKRNILTINMSNSNKEAKNADDQPTTVEFGNLGYSSWGMDASFSGTTYDKVSQAKDNVSFVYTRNSGSLYANSSAIRVYKSNTLTFTAPDGFVIKTITWGVTAGQSDITTNTGTCEATSSALSWEGSSKSVIFTRPSGASGYATLTSVTVTLERETPAVVVPATSISLNTNSLTITEGSTSSLSASILPQNATTTTLEWSTSDETVATVEDGLVTAVSEGEATIVVRVKDTDLTASCHVIVEAYVVPTYSSLSALIASGSPTETASLVNVTLTDVEITSIYTSSAGNRVGVFIKEADGTQDVEVFYSGVPEDWVAGGTLSGTIQNCKWVLYKTTWELAPEDWEWTSLTYTAPTITSDPSAEFTFASTSTVTTNGVTVSFDTGSGATAPAFSNGELRLYSSNTITVSSKNAISRIELVYHKQGSKAYSSASANVGTLTSGGSSTSVNTPVTDVWTGSSNTVVITLGSSGQRVIESIKVY